MNASYWLNTLWMAKCRAESRRFQGATRSVHDTQTRLLQRILTQNQRCSYGREHHFSKISDDHAFQQRVPISVYDDYHEAIARIAAGATRVLTSQQVRLLEPTSGSTSGEKLIPYTAELKRQFQRSIDAWIHNLMHCRPKLRSGRAYWSISPCLGPPRTTPSGIPIGFDDDVAYLTRWEQLAVRRLLAVPPTVAKLQQMDNFRYATLLHLLCTSDLTLISIWSPTFLTALFESLDEWIEPLCYDLRHGTITWPADQAGASTPLAAGRDALATRGSKAVDKKRADELAAAWGTSPTKAEFLASIWPRLQLISCWRDGAAAQYVPQLEQLFPGVEIQPKGLLATEACVSLPLCDRPGAALAIRSHFFEFAECDNLNSGTLSAPAEQCLCLAHELELGRRYRVVVTTGGGLYRYQLGDLIEVVGFENQCPLIRFLGRADRVTDLVGEKISEAHVRDVLQRAFSACQMDPDFAMLVPRSIPPGYQLLLQLAPSSDTESVERLGALVESGLSENPYYRHAIGTRQLAAMVITLLKPSTPGYWKKYETYCLAQGQKAGDIKPTVLGPTDWTGRPEG